MENASKALIIAGSILLSILIIAAGIYIFNMSNVDVETTMNQMEINIFNQEYLLYEGAQYGKRIREVLEKAAMYNEQYTGGQNIGSFNKLKEVGFGIRGSAEDILKEARKKSSDWVSQLTYANGDEYGVGVAQPVNIRLIGSWLKLDKKYKVSFTFFPNGRIREIVIDDINQ